MNITIAIIGAGIGGLGFAALAAAAGHRVQLFERFAQAAPVGSGLVVQPVGLAVLDRIGAGAEARRLGTPLHRMLGHAQGLRRLVLDVSYRADAPGLAMHRASLFHVLWQAAMASGAEVITGATVSAAPLHGSGRRVVLADGRSFGPFDLVVDASGAGSVLSPLRPRSLGYGAIWGTVPWPEATPLPPDQLRQRYRGAAQMMGVLPVGQMPQDPQRRAAVFWSLPLGQIAAWQAAPLDDWKVEAERLWPEVAPFLTTITRHDQMTPARYSHGSLRRPYATALAFLGDAAHRASPQLGQGANMALLDAMALAQALRMQPLADALPAYAAMRRWHLRLYQGMSALFTPMYQSGSTLLPPVRDHLLAPFSHAPLVRGILTRLVSGDLIPPLAGQIFP